MLSDAYLRSVLPTLTTLGDAKNRSAEAQTWAQQLRALVGNAWSAMLFKKPATSEVALAALKRSLRVGQERRSRIIAVTALIAIRNAPRKSPILSHTLMSMKSRVKSEAT